MGDAWYQISFFVNDKMGEMPKEKQDRQILTGVLNLLPKIAKKYKMEEIEIESWTDHNEFHVTRNLPVDETKHKLIEKIHEYITLANNNKLNFWNEQEKNGGIEMAKNFLNVLINGDVDINMLKNANIEFPPYSQISLEITALYKEFRKRVLSNTEEGYKVPKNRRHEIYKRLLPRFMPGWNIKEVDQVTTYKGFVLTRK